MNAHLFGKISFRYLEKEIFKLNCTNIANMSFAGSPEERDKSAGSQMAQPT
jgi:hypothetical protein